jgi:septum formation protein
MGRLILASASPRRRELLTALGIEFEVVKPQVAELTSGEPAEVVLANARLKAEAGLELAGAAEGDRVLGVDTDVTLDGRLLGKADDEAGARRRLETLSGRVHEVLSGGAVLEGGEGGEERCGVASTTVGFRPLEAPDIDRYVASGEWIDRAGAYAIQGLGSILVESLHGDISNVIGLPIALLLQLAPDLGKA